MNDRNPQLSAQNSPPREGESNPVLGTAMVPEPETGLPLETDAMLHDRYIRRHSHDVGNSLSVIDLLTRVLHSSADTGEVSNCIATVRQQIFCIAELQLRLGLRFRAPTSAAISLSSSVEMCRSRQRVGSAEHAIDWFIDGADCSFPGDAQAVSVILVEIADHWFAHGGGSISAKARDGNVCFQMQRAGAPTSTEGLSATEKEVKQELASVVARFGGTMVGDVDNTLVTIMFPAAPTCAKPLEHA